VSSSVPAVISSVRIIERLAGEWPSGVATSVLVSDLEMNRSTCYNILATLQESGWVTNLGARAGWRLGSRLFALGGGQDQQLRFVQSVIEDLSQDLGFVVFVAERHPKGGYGVIAKAERRSGVRVTAAIGDQFVFSAPALMQAFEAWTPREEFDRLVAKHGVTQFTEFTVTDPDHLHDRLAEVRRRGYSRSIREYNLAQGGVAAPIFDARGRTTLVLCTLGFSTDLNEKNVDAVGTRMREAADRVTERLGGKLPKAAG
jgi:DNA-binding IclR family transcriptional regulator